MANISGRIGIDPTGCGGMPCIRGTRIWVSVISDLLAAGFSEAELRAEYPALAQEDIQAATTYRAGGVHVR
jgi:uncharacterized protein (DUF433 family)